MKANCSEISWDNNINHAEACDILTEAGEEYLCTSPKSTISLNDSEADTLIAAEVEKIFLDLFQSDLSLFTDNNELKFGHLVTEPTGRSDYFDTDFLTRNHETQETVDEKSEEQKSNSRYSLRGFQLFKTIKNATPSLSRSDSTNSKAVEDTLSNQVQEEPEQLVQDHLDDDTSSRQNSVCKGKGEKQDEIPDDSKEEGITIFKSFRKRSNTLNSNFKSANSNRVEKTSSSPGRNLNRFNSLTSMSTKTSLSGTLQPEATSVSFSSPQKAAEPSRSLSTKSRKSFASFRSFTTFTSDEKLSRSSTQKSQFSTNSMSSWSSVSTKQDKSKSMEMIRSSVFVPLDIPKNLGDFSASSILNELGIDDKEVKRSQSLNSPLKTAETRFLRKNSSSIDLPLVSDWDKKGGFKVPLPTTRREFVSSRQLSQSLRPSCNEARYFVAEEIFNTEISYLENLEIILNTFMIPIQDMARTSDPIVRPHDTKIIFQGIEPLYKLSQELCYELKHKIENWSQDSRIGCLFLKHKKSWDIYPRFVDNYSFAREAIQRAEGTTSFGEFIKNVAKNDTKRQTLKEFLIIPIQRVTRYTLLLKDLQKQTREDHPDYPEVTQALKFMKDLAVQVNEVKQKEEERTQLFAIFNSIRNCPPTMINSKRRFMLETDLTETRTNRKLHLVLYSDYLMLATPGKGRQTKAGEKWAFLRLIDLRHIILFNVPDTKDANNLTVIFVSNPIPTAEPDCVEPIGSQSCLPPNPTYVSQSSPPPSPRSSSRTSFVESRKRSFSKKQIPNQYVFQHPDRKSKVEFLIALENELSNIRKRLGGQPRNFIQTFNHLPLDTF
ncbi:hypothetical protein K7432_003164 [Basidiobolus ranarum]|uniref:DH domain-containing protein n=1 Tax=Basidiobolus ranarum TaxID=34480 RepID=A0ABR2X0D4_9FUNG